MRTGSLILIYGVILSMTVVMTLPAKSVVVLSSGEYDKFGSFILDNTSEQKEMVGALPPLARIGTAWNLTVSVGGNSTSGVNITFHEHFAHVIDWWEGVKMFTVSPSLRCWHRGNICL